MKQTEHSFDNTERGRLLFSPGMKLADLVESNYELLVVLARMGIPLGFGESSVGEVCRQRGISAELFLMICRIYSSEVPVLPYEQLTSDDLGGVLDYLHTYRREVDNHFDYEERTVFPYVQALLEKRRVDGYNILCFEDNHSDIDGKLCDLKNIIIKYLPENCSAKLRYEVLSDIFRFEEDLSRHTVIENQILIPLVEKLEKNG